MSDGAALPGKLGFWDVQQARGLLPNRPPTQQQQQQGGGEGKGDGRVADKGWVARELLAQLARFRLLVGRYPSHVDGHNHVHVCNTRAQDTIRRMSNDRISSASHVFGMTLPLHSTYTGSHAVVGGGACVAAVV